MLIARAAKSKKAENIFVLDLRKISTFTDFFVIASGSSTRKVKAIADGIEKALDKKHLKVGHKEGYSEAKWILLDCADVIAHIFHTETRQFYSLERLWGDAKQIPLSSIAMNKRKSKQ